LEQVQKEMEYGEFLKKLAFLINSSIQRRVQNEGLKPDNSKLSPYSKQYAAFKSKRGRQVGYRDLTYTGNMWQALTATKMGKQSAKLFFAGAEQAKKAGYNDERTPFFEIGEREKQLIDRELKKFLNKI
jgi:hypothetical protein